MTQDPARTTVKCSACGASYGFEVRSRIDAARSPELKAAVLDGSLFISECPVCGKRELRNYPLVYSDGKLLICLSDIMLKAQVPEGLTARQVRDAGSLIEKIKIFDASLDDVAIELCKFVTRQEMERDADLRFLALDGPDHDLVFTYPADGRMEMLSTGFNVYEDCCAIVRRNPELTPPAGSLERVDREWIEQYLK